jgi:hypothetical protein
MATTTDWSDIIKVVFIAFAPSVVSFFGAIAVTNAAEEAIHAATPQEALDRFIWFVIIWLLIPGLQFIMASLAMGLSIHSRLAMRLAPWLLGVGFIASLTSIASYAHFLSLLNEKWRGITQFTYFTPLLLTYLIAANQLLSDYG